MDDRDRARLVAMLDSARLAIEHVRTGGPDWKHDQKTVDAASKRVEEVGEQAKRVSPEQQAAMPGVRWPQVKGMRDRMAHDYGRLDVEILADVVESDLPDLIKRLEAALAEPDTENAGNTL